MTVGNTKEKVLEVVEGLPEDVTVEDVMEHLYFLAKVQRGLMEADKGETVPHAEIKKRLGGE